MNATHDFLIIGAGGIGLSSAYHILMNHPTADVVIVDRLPGAGQANSSKSAGNYRFVFSSYLSYLFNYDGLAFFQHVQNTKNRDMGIKQLGRLYLMSDRAYSKNRDPLQKLVTNGLELEVIEGKKLQDITTKIGLRLDVSNDDDAKVMELENITKAAYCSLDGSFSPEKLCSFYEAEIISRGGKILYNTEVKSLLLEPTKPLGIDGEPFEWQDKQFAGVLTNLGEIRAKTIVIAAGVWTPSLLDPVGIDAHARAKKRQIFVVKATTTNLKSLLDVEGFNVEKTIPILMFVTKSKIIVKPIKSENAFWILGADDVGRPFKLENDPRPERDFFTYGLRMPLKAYMPQFATSNPFTSWAGQYAYNTFDDQPYVSQTENLVVVTGDSGMGLVASPTLGKAVSTMVDGNPDFELYCGGRLKVTDLGISPSLRKTEEEMLMG